MTSCDYDKLTEAEWEAAMAEAVAAFRGGARDAALFRLFGEAAEQYPYALHPYLPELVGAEESLWRDLRLGWRGSGRQFVPFLTARLRALPPSPEPRPSWRYWTGRSNDPVWHAFEALLETRDLAAFDVALSAAPAFGLGDEELRFLFHNVGYAAEAGVPRRLCLAEAFHVQFPAGYDRYGPGDHPTRALPADLPRYRFGGVAEGGAAVCCSCGDVLDHLLTLEAGATGWDDGELPPALHLATCLTCVGWEQSVLFVRHDAGGLPTGTVGAERVEAPQFPTAPFVETRVALTPTPRRWYWREERHGCPVNLHRVGGYPAWIQEPEHPDCPDCGRGMTFLLQLGPTLPLEDTPEEQDLILSWGDLGIAYFFWCGTCRVSAGTWRCS